MPPFHIDNEEPDSAELRRPLLPRRSAVLLGLGVAFGIVVSLGGQAPPYDLLIRNARVVDGTGSPWYRSDIGIRGDEIATIARRIDAPSTRTIDAQDQVAAPGFIDIHVHAFGGAGRPPVPLPIVEVPTADNYVRQGVTTLVTGPDGFSPVPLEPALALVAKTGIVPNIGAFAGHGSIRETVFGRVNRPPTANELERMRALAREAMRDGAFGLSTGLFYVPATFSKTDEIVELATVVGQLGGIHISHMRDEELDIEASVRETIAIGERGVDVTVDLYPYTASATSISAALMPTWAQEGTRDDVLKRLRDPDTRRKILVATLQILLDGRGGGDPRNVMVSRCDWNADFAGRRLDEVARMRGKPGSIEDAADTALWLVENGDCGGIYFAISEDDIQRVLRHPASMVASDGQVVVFGRASPHPRSYGTFARVLGRYVRDLKILTLEDAVRKMSSYPAQRLGLRDRGVLRERNKADVVIFDPAAVRDLSTFEQPHQYAQGVSLVIINGQPVFENGAITSARPGRVLYGPAHTP
jgi:N-acyl-D-amino-acid deacylase